MRSRVIALVAPIVLISSCANGVAEAPVAAPGPSTSASAWLLYQGSPSADPDQLVPGEGGPPSTVASGTFLPFRPGSTAITYDPAVVPPGARVRLAITKIPYGMVVRLTAAGLIPRRAYGAHLHTMPCTAVPDEAGPHYQHRQDPSSPSVDPSYANPHNEVWLDFTADASGSATAVSRQDWSVGPAAMPRSLVIHAERTSMAAGMAGKAGPRAACLTLPAQ
jgi:Cu-Zn family superoxide dismutase